MYGILILLHVLAATVWTGGHLVLATTILPRALRSRDIEPLRAFESAYERIGIPALIVQIVSGVGLAHRLIPNPAQWLDFANPVARIIAIKLILLAITAAFALDARLRIIPRLDAGRLNALAWHIVPVTVVSVLFVFVGVAFRTGWLY